MLSKNKRFGDIVRDLMESKGLKAGEVANLTGMPYNSISRIITGNTENPSANTLLALGKAFNVSVSTLLGEEPTPTTNQTEIARPDTPITRIPILERSAIKQWFYSGELNRSEALNAWTPATNNNISHNAFAFINDNTALSKVFPKGALLIADPGAKYHNNDYVIASINKNLPSLRQIIEDSDSYYLGALGLLIPSEKLEPPHVVFGKIVEYRFYFE